MQYFVNHLLKRKVALKMAQRRNRFVSKPNMTRDDGNSLRNKSPLENISASSNFWSNGLKVCSYLVYLRVPVMDFDYCVHRVKLLTRFDVNLERDQ